MEIIKNRIKKVRKIFNELENKSSYNKLKSLKNYYNGKNAIIVTCGPSLEHYKDKIINLVNENTILICVKQSINRVNYICDFHLRNFINDKDRYTKKGWNYPKYNRPIVLYNYRHKKFMNKFIDIGFSAVGKNKRDILKDVINDYKSMDFNDESIQENKMEVNSGHIICEMALPLCTQLGIKNVFIIGWDGGNGYSYAKEKGRNLTYSCHELVMKCNAKLNDYCNKYYDMNIYQINDYSLYDIPKITIEEYLKKFT